MRKTVVAALLLAALPAAALAINRIAVQPNTLKWGPAPPGLPPGAQVAVVASDPGKEGRYVVGANLPADYRFMRHTHPTAENVTMLSGTFHIAMGDKFNLKKGEVAKAGGFFIADRDMPDFGWTTSPTVIQIQGMGPFAINYINPSDDPGNAKRTAKQQ